MHQPETINIQFTPFDPFFSAWRDMALTGWRTYAQMWTAYAGSVSKSPAQALHFYLPFSGDVLQNISPDTNWGIQGNAGAPELERAILDNVASYGRQLGWIIDLVDDLADKTPNSDTAKHDKIRELRAQIRDMKTAHGISEDD